MWFRKTKFQKEIERIDRDISALWKSVVQAHKTIYLLTKAMNTKDNITSIMEDFEKLDREKLQ